MTQDIYKRTAEILKGKVRGKPVAIHMFKDAIPEAFEGRKVDPCAIVRHAMDLGERVYVDRKHQDCLSGAYTGGFHEGSEITRSGQYIADNISAYSAESANLIKNGTNRLPQGTAVGFGASPLDDVPDGVPVDWICVVCTPYWANFIGAARSVIDATPPLSSCGFSFCADLFASVFHHDNVVVTPGDIGGRMNNKLKAEELFVVVPVKYLDSLIKILSETPDAKKIYESIKPEDSPYWEKKKKKAEREAAKKAERAAKQSPAKASATPDKPLSLKARFMRWSTKLMVKFQGSGDDMGDLPFTMDWDVEAEALIRKAPKSIVPMAISNVEDFADEHGHDLITRAVIVAQMEDSGMDVSMLDG